MSVTKEQLAAGLNTIRAVADAIRELKQVPSGVLYGNLTGVLSLPEYEKIIGILKNTGLVRESLAHLLTWIEPTKGKPIVQRDAGAVWLVRANGGPAHGAILRQGFLSTVEATSFATSSEAASALYLLEQRAEGGAK